MSEVIGGFSQVSTQSDLETTAGCTHVPLDYTPPVQEQPRIWCEPTLITPALAAEWLKSMLYWDQRPLSQAHVQKLVRAMEKGQFEDVDTIKLYRLDGTDYIMDGQHRLTAIIQYGKPIWLLVARKEVSLKDELMSAYGRIDRGKIRGQREALRGMGVSLATGLDPAEVNQIGNAYKIIATGFEKSTAEDRVLFADTDWVRRGVMYWKEQAQEYGRILDNANGFHKKQLRRSVVTAIALVTLKHQNEVAEDFWTKMAFRDRLQKDSGPWHLAEGLNKNFIIGLGGFTKYNSDLEFARYIASCWNVYFAGSTIREPRVHGNRSIHMSGTPYNGRTVYCDVAPGD